MAALQRRIACGPVALGLLVLYAALAAFVLPWASAHLGPVGPLDLKLLYAPAKAYGSLSSYGPAGRAFYAWYELTGDVLYPTVYTLCLASASGYFLGRDSRLPLYIYPAWLFDLLENLGIVAQILLFPRPSAGLVYATQAMTLFKFGFVAYGLLLTVVSGVRFVVRRLTPGRTAA